MWISLGDFFGGLLFSLPLHVSKVLIYNYLCGYVEDSKENKLSTLPSMLRILLGKQNTYQVHRAPGGVVDATLGGEVMF